MVLGKLSDTRTVVLSESLFLLNFSISALRFLWSSTIALTVDFVICSVLGFSFSTVSASDFTSAPIVSEIQRSVNPNFLDNCSFDSVNVRSVLAMHLSKIYPARYRTLQEAFCSSSVCLMILSGIVIMIFFFIFWRLVLILAAKLMYNVN